MGNEVETKTIEIYAPVNRRTRRLAQQALEREARQGWRLVQIRQGGLFSRWDTAILVRDGDR